MLWIPFTFFTDEKLTLQMGSSQGTCLRKLSQCAGARERARTRLPPKLGQYPPPGWNSSLQYPPPFFFGMHRVAL